MKIYFFKNKETGKYVTMMSFATVSGEMITDIDYDDPDTFSSEDPERLSNIIKNGWYNYDCSSRLKADFEKGLIELVEITLP